MQNQWKMTYFGMSNHPLVRLTAFSVARTGEFNEKHILLHITLLENNVQGWLTPHMKANEALSARNAQVNGCILR